MKIITKFKDRFSYPIKHQKEKIVIAITLICFLISGFSLPSIRAAYGIEPVEDTITQQDSDSKDANTVQTKKTKKTEKKKEDKEEADKEDIEESDKEDKEEIAEAQKDFDNDGKNEKSSEKKGLRIPFQILLHPITMPEVPAAPETHLPLLHHRRRYGCLLFIRPFIMTLYIILSK